MRATIDVPADLIPHSGVIGFTVVGDSMTPDILDGDNVVVDPYATVQDGDIGVVWIRTPAAKGLVVKRVVRQGETVRLESSNPAYAPEVVRDAVVIGRVVLIQRFTDTS
jgi:SOS-response transcriptional repressor LexA